MFDKFLKKFSLEERSWIKYDIANSAYTLTVVTCFFPIILNAITDFDSTSLLQKVTGWYALAIALLAPILGNIADYKGHKKVLFKIFLFSGLIFGILLAIPVVPWQVYLAFYVIATLGYTGANIFYDSFLTDITDEDNFDKVSSNGFAWGYIGSTIPFIIGLAIFGLQKFGIINMEAKFAIAIAFLISIIWWAVFSRPLIKNVNQRYYIDKPKKWVSAGFRNVLKTLKVLSKDPKVLLFLIGYFFYIDAVGTIIKSAVNLGDALDVTDDITLVSIVLLVQFIAFPCAIIFGNLAKKIGEIPMLAFGVIIYIGICTLGFFISTQVELFIFAGLVGLVQGGVQAVSRSYFGKLIPKERSGDYFGFFNIFGKFAAILGPFITGYTMDFAIKNGSSTAQAARTGIFSLVPLLIIGLIFLLIASRKKSNKEKLRDLELQQ